jgi:spore coat protein CotH
MGEEIASYERRFEMKTDDPKAWKALIHFCKVLNETPLEELDWALEPLVDMEELLWFLALDNALINCDGYWIRASDYSIFLDEHGKFHFIPHDMNEAFRPAMGPGMGGFGPPGGFGGGFGPPGGFPGFGGPPPEGGPLPGEQRPEGGPPAQTGSRPEGGRGGGRMGGGSRTVDLDPLTGLDDVRKPLRSRILSIPYLQQNYLQKVRTIAEKSLDWKSLGPVIAGYRDLIEEEVKRDTRKLGSHDEFVKATSDNASVAAAPQTEERQFGPPRNHLSLRNFADQRRKFLLEKIPAN